MYHFAHLTRWQPFFKQKYYILTLIEIDKFVNSENCDKPNFKLLFLIYLGLVGLFFEFGFPQSQQFCLIAFTIYKLQIQGYKHTNTNTKFNPWPWLFRITTIALSDCFFTIWNCLILFGCQPPQRKNGTMKTLKNVLLLFMMLPLTRIRYSLRDFFHRWSIEHPCGDISGKKRAILFEI